MYEYSCEVVRVIDSNNVECKIDLGFNISMVKHIRLWGITAWKIITSDPEEKRKGIEAKNYLINCLDRGYFVLKSHKDYTGEYGYLLGEIYINGVNINDRMLKLGHAVKYMRV